MAIYALRCVTCREPTRELVNICQTKGDNGVVCETEFYTCGNHRCEIKKAAERGKKELKSLRKDG